jgi:hypothetical protein
MMSVDNTVDSTRFVGVAAGATGDERFNLVERPVSVAGKPHMVVPVELHPPAECVWRGNERGRVHVAVIATV